MRDYNQAMERFVSEPIEPHPRGFDTHAMGMGLPGLPPGFLWRGREWTILAVLESWKHSEPEGGRSGGERYLRRHYFKLRMDGGDVWTVYFLRQRPRSGSAKARWHLYSIAAAGAPSSVQDAGDENG
ncbi:MAG: cytoplasmic protein [Phycisphaerae bacterium]|jgi:hypothetical protein